MAFFGSLPNFWSWLLNFSASSGGRVAAALKVWLFAERREL